jgi:hypothetical protein
MRYTSKAIEREVTGPFIGKRFPSLSDDVVDALLTVEYRFEGFTITVAGIPARWDRSTGAEYVTGRVGREVNERVTTLAAIMERQQRPLEQVYQREGRLNRARMIADVLQTTPFRLSLNLPHAA